MSTETWKPLTPEDDAKYKGKFKTACESLSESEKKLLYKMNREVFHTGRPTVGQIIRLGTLSGNRNSGTFRAGGGTGLMPGAFEEAVSAYMDECYEKAFPLMKSLAEAGHPVACFLLALMYKNGEGAEQSDSSYNSWLQQFQRIAELGNPLAQWELSCRYRWGDHFTLDNELANFWLEEAAQGGSGEAQHHLGWYYENGEYGYPKDLSLAEIWYRRALAEGNPETMYMLAMRQCKDGQPSEEALSLLRKAAAKGFSEAERALKAYLH